MPRTDQQFGPTQDGPTGQLRAAQAETAALRRQLTELQADMEQLIAGLCYAALHDGRGGRVGLPILWRYCLDRHAQP